MKTCTPPPSPRVPMGLALAVAFGLGCAGLKAAPTADHLAPDVRGCVEAPSRGCIEALRAASRRDDRAGVAQTLMAMAPRSEAEDILRAFSLLVLKRPVLPPHTTIEDLDASRKTVEAGGSPSTTSTMVPACCWLPPMPSTV